MNLVRLGSVFYATALLVVACGSDSTGGGSTDGTDAGISPGTFDGGAKADSSTDAGAPAPVGFSIGGSVSGLRGTGLVLQDNAGDDLPIAADGTFTFAKKLATGAAFAITIKTQPTAPSQTCSVSGESGTVAGGNVTGVVVNCSADKFTVGGTITGLVGTGLVLQNNLAGDLIVNANGTFAFATPVASGAAYAVTVKTQPGTPSQTCTVASGSGNVAATKVSNVAISCTTNKYTVGGMVTGLSGTGLVLKVNGGDSLPVAASGAFTFVTPITSGATYAVTVGTQPGVPAQTCTLMGGTGTVGAANVTSVAVNCTTNKYTIGGTVSGVAGAGVVLQNNGGNDLTVAANGTFAFSTPIDAGAPYAVTIKTQPTSPSQTCTLSNASGNVAAAPVADIVLTCTTNRFVIGGSVTGLAGSGLVLQDNAGDDLAIAADGTFAFATPVASGKTYAVTVKAQPTAPSQSCVVTNGNMTVGGADVTTVGVTCSTNSYTVGGSVAGLAGTGLVLQDNLGDDLTIPLAGGPFTFATAVRSGNLYSVTVKTQPSNATQTCTVAAPSGTVTNGNVVTVMVNCTTNKYAIGGAVSGLAGTGLVLQNKLGDDLTVNTNGNYAFATPIASGQTYAVTVKTQPTNPTQTCVATPATASGTVGGAAITNAAVTCTTNTYTVGGSISGVTGTVVLQDNLGDDKTLTVNGAFTFATSIASGATYSVTVKSPPASSSCVVTAGTGTVGAAPVTNVTITCTPCSANSVAFGGRCYYLDGSGGACDLGYALASQAVLSSISASFIGLNYKHTISDNCCIWNADALENWGMQPHCNVDGPFTAGDVVLGGAGCTNANNRQAKQLTLCGTP